MFLKKDLINLKLFSAVINVFNSTGESTFDSELIELILNPCFELDNSALETLELRF